MFRTGVIFCFCLFAIALLAFLAVRHREVLRAAEAASSTALTQDDSPDVAAALRTLSDPSGDPSHPSSKTWAIQFAQFVNSHPGGQWVIGRCERPSLSEAEAAESAHADAGRKILPIILRRLNVSHVDAGWIRDRVYGDVRDGRLDADRFAEQFNRPYGQVWAESVLADVSPSRVDPLLAEYHVALGARHLQLRRHLAIAAVLSILTILAYLLLNSLTRGYFTTRLRIAATAIVTVLIFFLVRGTI